MLSLSRLRWSDFPLPMPKAKGPASGEVGPFACAARYPPRTSTREVPESLLTSMTVGKDDLISSMWETV